MPNHLRRTRSVLVTACLPGALLSGALLSGALTACAFDASDPPPADPADDRLATASSAVTASTEQIRQVYRDTLGREPAVGEVNIWVANLAQGGWTLATMRDAFARDAQCRAAVTAVYQQTLERTPAAWEVDFWQQQILANNTIPAMRDAFVRSAEGTAKIQLAHLTVIHLVASPEDTATGQAKISTGGLTLATYRSWLATQLRYDQVYQRSLHNAYQTDKHAGVIDQLVYYGVRDLEWDLRSQPPSNVCGLEHAPNNDWFTYHAAAPLQDGRFYRLSDGLQLLAGFHTAVPEHEIVTLHLELKGGHDGASCDVAFPDATANNNHDPARQTPEGLDALLRARLGNALLTPAELLGRCPGATTLQEAVATCGWPLLDGLRGRILVTVHAGNWSPANHAEDSYRLYAGPSSADATKRVAFLAPLTFVNSSPTTPPAFGGLANNPGVVMHTDGSAWATGLLLPQFPHHVVRAPMVGSGSDFVSTAAAQLFPWIQTDAFDVHANPLIRTANAHGYPFCPIGVVGANCALPGHALGNARERRHLLAIDVRSGDIAGTSDDLAMAASFGVLPGQTNTWTAFISNASNANVHPWAKGCLMARYQLTPDSPYYAICRAGDDRELFVQYRSFGCSGTCGTAQTFASLGHNQQGEDATFVKLRVWSDGGGGQWAQGFGSVDGASWQGIGSPVHFPQELVLQGIAASSNVPSHPNADGTPTRFLFGNVVRNGMRQAFGFTPVRYRDGGVIRTAEPLAVGLTTGNVPLSSFVDRSYFGDL